MSIGLLFWILFVIAVFFGAYVRWPGQTAPPQIQFGGDLLLFVLLFLLGWGIFGFVVHG